MPPKRAAPADSVSTSADAGPSTSTTAKRAKRGEETAAAAAADEESTERGWKTINDVLAYQPPGIAGNTRIIGFDIDDTIITTKSGKTFATSAADWQFWDATVPAKLQEFHGLGYKIVFFSNQGGISKGQTTAAIFKRKLRDVLAAVKGVPIQVYASTTSGKYRKPATGMWGMFTKGGNGGVEVDLTKSMYVGDAAGRAKNWQPNKKKDFSDSDRKFALNLGIAFKTPEEFFLGQTPAPFTLEGADPRLLKADGPMFEPANTQLIASQQEMVVMVGYPGSGKSFFTEKELEQRGGYTRVNRDTLKTKEKCLKVAEEALAAGHSVVIDNTNPDVEARAPYLALAKRYKVPVRAFVMQTTFDEAMHNNMFREVISNGENEHVPSVVYYTFRKKYIEPTVGEGYTQVVKTFFRPKFTDPFVEKIFYMWTPL